MVLNQMTYKIITTFLVLLHIPLFFLFNQFIEINGAHYPLPVILIILHTWLWIESRSKYVNIKTKFHLYGILTGFMGFFSNVGFHIIPNIFAVISGMVLVGTFATGEYLKEKRRRDNKAKTKDNNKDEVKKKSGFSIIKELKNKRENNKVLERDSLDRVYRDEYSYEDDEGIGLDLEIDLDGDEIKENKGNNKVINSLKNVVNKLK